MELSQITYGFLGLWNRHNDHAEASRDRRRLEVPILYDWGVEDRVFIARCLPLWLHSLLHWRDHGFIYLSEKQSTATRSLLLKLSLRFLAKIEAWNGQRESFKVVLNGQKNDQEILRGKIQWRHKPLLGI